MYRTPRGVLDWLVQKDGNWKAVELKPKYITNHGRSLLDSVRAGDGIAFLPSWGVASDIESGRMVKIELEDGLYLSESVPKRACTCCTIHQNFGCKKLE